MSVESLSMGTSSSINVLYTDILRFGFFNFCVQFMQNCRPCLKNFDSRLESQFEQCRRL